MEDFLLALKPTFPDVQMLKSQVYPSTNLAVIETSFIALDECVCNQFHYIISMRQSPLVRMEKKLIKLKEMSVFPCNPMQSHQIEETGITDFKALILYFENTFLKTMAEELFGNRNLVLTNNCFELSPGLKELIYTYIRESRAKQPGSSLMLESLSVQAAILLLRESYHNLSFSAYYPREYYDNNCIKKVIEYITDNFQSKISLSDLACETHYSQYHLLRLFKQYTGKTPFEFLLDLKIEKAKGLLQSTNFSIEQICDLCGFSGLSYFSQVFKKKTGLTPTQFKGQYNHASKLFFFKGKE
ncbi:MAG TPA: AraC family transcriptional regulator [Bacillota bacterium]|nr:AraC family transcriptional regulator [Bacillota bacterium]HQI15840.1 AraC family transcriptional regulator [Bacillota bacterium]HRS21164.1 AraC family transcriptional regulator [Clostridia bacterium]HRU41992.1 AraC family transcriptional regulator [Candidatus Diapherotrites archaeon]